MSNNLEEIIKNSNIPFDIVQLHTTQLGVERIRRNLRLSESVDVVEHCRSLILDATASFERRGKNWYIMSGDCEITVNAGSCAIITAHNRGGLDIKGTIMYRLNHLIILLVILLSVGTGCSTTRYVKHERQYSHMEDRLATYIAAQDAGIGVAVIIDGTDTVSVNGSRDFPMLSVYKFPQALAVADYCMRKGIELSDTISIQGDEMKENTWSPMRDRYGVGDLRLSLSELLEYSLRDSDNNACDILFRLIGGTHVADSLMKAMDFGDIDIASTEDEMHRDIYLCYQNCSTPIAMAGLFDRFYRQEMRHDSPLHEAIGEIMMTCITGNRRLPAPLMSTNALIGHKTGTGDVNSRGRIIAVNDAGYVFLPNGGGYAVAVFVSDSARNMEETERMIADISDIIFRSLLHK